MVVETLKAGVCIVERTCCGLQTMEPRISETPHLERIHSLVDC
jgi:hypothetical protein